MPEVYIYALLSVFIVSLISLVGIFTLSLNESLLRKYIFLLTSLAVGALFGDAFVHLIPQAFEQSTNPSLISLALLLGIITFFVLEKFLHWHHHTNEEETHKHEHEQLLDENHAHKMKPLGVLVLTSDSVHNFIDGVVIGVSYLVSVEVGIATTIAVILHEIPQEISDFGLLLHAGFSRMRAIFLNFATALFAVLGTMIALSLQTISGEVLALIAAFAAGNFIYIAGSDLVPELHKTVSLRRSLIQFVAVITGIALMFALLLFE